MRASSIRVVHAFSGKELFVMSSCVIPRVEELISFVCEDRAKGDFKDDEWAAMKAASEDQLFVVIDVWHQYTLHNADLPEHHIATLSVLTAEEYDAEDDEGDDDGGGQPHVSFLRPVKHEPTESDHKPSQGAQDESAQSIPSSTPAETPQSTESDSPSSGGLRLLAPCPHCGFRLTYDEPGVFHPSGIGWRDNNGRFRSYHSFREVPREQWCYEVNCDTTIGGCGANISGDSPIEAVTAWNRRPVQVPAFVEQETFAGSLALVLPIVGADENGCATLEWWRGTRKLTLYTVASPFEALLKVWGPNIDSEMEYVSVLDSHLVCEAFQWLRVDTRAPDDRIQTDPTSR